MQLPQHLNKNPHSSKAHDAMMKLEGYFFMQSLRRDGEGFRKAPSSRKGSKSRAKQLSTKPSNRQEKLADIAYG